MDSLKELSCTYPKEINQLQINGRTDEETEPLNHIIRENSEEMEAFLRNSPKQFKWIGIYEFDFTEDAKDEIICAKEYVEGSGIIAYNYVFDGKGDCLLAFAGGDFSNMELYHVKSKEDLFYTKSHMILAVHNDLWLYGEIQCKEETEADRLEEYVEMQSGAKPAKAVLPGTILYYGQDDKFAWQPTEDEVSIQ